VRVIHVISGLDQGGAESMLEKLLLAGRRLDPQIQQSVICLGEPGVVGERLAQAGVLVEALCLRRSVLRLCRQLIRLTRALRDPNSSMVVQTWLWHADLLGGICARLAGNAHVVWNLRNSMPGLADTKVSSRGVAYLCAGLSRWVPARIVCNSAAALRAHAAIGYSRTKCVVIPNGFDMHIFTRSLTARAAVRAAWGVRSADLLVGMVARVDPQKDHATFIRAARSVASSMPGVRFALVGAGVTTDPLIRTLLAKLSLADRFVLDERRSDIPAVMSALDLFCLAARSEGFPNVVGEAMACGTATVATDVGDVREIIADEHLVALPQDPDSLAACMRRVLSLSATEYSELVTRQRQIIADRFDIDVIWRRYRDLYNASLNGPAV
jgi:glycosyltransferase involved in cell wall biosynthesis